MDRHPILIDDSTENLNITRRRKKRQKRLAMVEMWNKRKERRDRLKELNRVNYLLMINNIDIRVKAEHAIWRIE